MAEDIEFCLLGPLLVRRAKAVIRIPPGKRRALLARLLLSANQVVPLDDLTETLWGASPPESARVTLQNYVKWLRKSLGDTSHCRIGTAPHGYVINVESAELDVNRFEELAHAAKKAACEGAWDQAAAQSRAALSLWRGEPLADVGSEVLIAREVPRLAELRLLALETRIDTDLHLGRHAEVIAELRQLASTHPMRERWHGLLMLALYYDGRQAEALAAYQQARRVLIEELGTEPGTGLRGLHQQMLTADPALELAQPRRVVADSVVTVTPRELPPAILHFTGRTSELAVLNGLLDRYDGQMPGTVMISAIGGTAGVGKTALAVRWAHQAAGRFPDGQLYVNLRGFDPAGSPTDPADAIRAFLEALGIPPGHIPASAEAQAGLYRSLLSGKRVLIVLDNARDEQQVRPLLPAGPASLVLVTSRYQLSGLAAAEGAQLLTLDVLSHDEAIQLLTARLGHDRIAAKPAAVDRIAGLCACLPLALAVAAARAATRPAFPLAALVDELADSADRLDALDAGDPAASVRAVFSWSTWHLSDDAARMFRLLGIHPGPDISVPAAASLAATAESDARALLRELARAHLITEHVPGRYAFHDLLRAYAAEQAQHTDSDADRREATGRVLDHYLHTAARAAHLINPSTEPVVLVPPRPGAAAGQSADHRQALAWFEAEHQVLLAALTLATGSGPDRYAWQLPWAMTPFLQARGHYHEWAATQRTALAAASRLGDTAAQALSGRLLATACSQLGDHDQARGHYASSLALYQRLGNRFGQAKIHLNLSVLAEQQGRYADALRHDVQALRLYQVIGDKANEAEALNSVGWDHVLLGNYQQARGFCRQALTLSAETGDRWTEAAAWDSLGYAEHHLGNLAEAGTCYQRALGLYREVGARLGEADTLTHLGDTLHAAGELAQAQEARHQALDILEDLQHPDADLIRAKLAGTSDHSSSNGPG